MYCNNSFDTESIFKRQRIMKIKEMNENVEYDEEVHEINEINRQINSKLSFAESKQLGLKQRIMEDILIVLHPKFNIKKSRYTSLL